VGALAEIHGNQLKLSAAVLSSDGARRLIAGDSTTSVDSFVAVALGHLVAEALLAQGAAELIAAARI
jgi:porphobilinogen deaminase